MPIQILKAQATLAAAGLVQVASLRRPVAEACKVMVHAVTLRSHADQFFAKAWAYFMDSDGAYFFPIGLGNKITTNLGNGTLWKGIVEWPPEWSLLIGCVTNEDAQTLDALVAYEVVPLKEYHRWW